MNKEQKDKHIVCSNTNVVQVSLLLCRPILIFYFSTQEHRQNHGTSREPLLENITSDYDLELFRKAQARASEDLVRYALLIGQSALLTLVH